MAKFIYELFHNSGTEGTLTDESVLSKKVAIERCRKNNKKKQNEKLHWDRWVSIEPTDFPDPENHAGLYLHESEFERFVNNEQNTYARCPWAGTAVELTSDEKYTLYRTDNFEYRKKIGFYLVDNNPKIK